MKEWKEGKKLHPAEACRLYQALAAASLVLVWPRRQPGLISGRAWMLYLLLAGGGLLWYWARKERGESFVPSRGFLGGRTAPLVWLLGGFLAVDILYVLAGAAAGKETGRQAEMLLLAALFFPAFLGRQERRPVFVRVLLVCAVPVYLGLLWHSLVDPAAELFLGGLLEDRQGLVVLLLLVSVLASEGYCLGKEKEERAYCLVLALAGYFLLLAQGDAAGNVLMSGSLLASLCLHQPQKEQVKRTGQLGLAWVLMLSNMSLIANYTGLLKTGCRYGLEGSVYLELGAAAVCAVIFHWWDRLPEEDCASGLYRMRSAVRKASGGLLLAAVVVSVSGGRFAGLAGQEGSRGVLGNLAGIFRTGDIAGGGTFYDCLEQWGVPGFLWMTALWVTAVCALAHTAGRGGAQGMLAVPALVYVAGSLFYSQQMESSPAGMILCGLALCGDSRKEPEAAETGPLSARRRPGEARQEAQDGQEGKTGKRDK